MFGRLPIHRTSLLVLPVVVATHSKLALDGGVEAKEGEAHHSAQPRRPEAHAREQRHGEEPVRVAPPRLEPSNRRLACVPD